MQEVQQINDRGLNSGAFKVYKLPFFNADL